jgi:hypothetical protein
MPVETGLWRIQDSLLKEVPKCGLKSESDLHRWIETNPRLVSSDLFLIGSEVVTEHGGRIDLLGVDSAGTVHVIELKKDRTPREVIAQALDYASWVVTLNFEALDKLCRAYRKTDITTAYQEHFKDSMPETLNDEHSITIVASTLDPSSERIVQYLSEYHDLNINAVFFTVFEDGNGRMLSRSYLLEPEKVSARAEQKSERKERGEWTGFYFVNIGMGPKGELRSWEDDRRFGVVSGGGGVRWRAFMQMLQCGDKIFAYAKSRGYVGFGIVTTPAVMARDYRLPSGENILSERIEGPQLRENVTDEELAEYVVGIDWKCTFDLDQARTYKGIFRIQQTVNKIYDAETVDFLKRQFNVPD